MYKESERRRLHKCSWWENPKERDHYEGLEVDGIILKYIWEKYDWCVSWIHLAQVTEQWQALVNTVMNLRSPWNTKGSFIGCTVVWVLRSNLHGTGYDRTELLPWAVHSFAKHCSVWLQYQWHQGMKGVLMSWTWCENIFMLPLQANADQYFGMFWFIACIFTRRDSGILNSLTINK
jgi:hypothetical protein